MTELRYVSGSHGPRGPCQRCGKPFSRGDKVVSRVQGRSRLDRKGYGHRTKYYHEECWEKLFL